MAAHATDAPDSLLKSALYPNAYFVGANIRNLAEAAKNDHLSFFATSEGSRLARMSLPRTAYSPPKPKVTRPTNGAVLRGQEYLVATVFIDYPLTSVNFQIKILGGNKSNCFMVIISYTAGWESWSPRTFQTGPIACRASQRIRPDTPAQARLYKSL